MSKHKSKRENTLPGDTGYRTRDGHSGLDPIETNLEYGRLQGQFIRRLFTGKLYLRKPIYIVITAAIGITLFAIPVLGIITQSGTPAASMLCPALIFWVIALLFLYNAAQSLRILNRSRGSALNEKRHTD